MRQPGTPPPTDQGFSLIESLVALLLVSLFLLGAVSLFEQAGRAARTSSGVAELQQAVRTGQHEMARLARSAGRGGLPRRLAVVIRSDTPEEGPEARIAREDPRSPEALPGTDVVTVRGVLTGTLFQVDPESARLLGDPPESGSVAVLDPAPSRVAQALEELAKAIESGRPEALLLVSSTPSLHAVVELDSSASRVADDSLTVAFRATGGRHTSSYRKLTPASQLRQTVESLAAVGILEEYSYYVREEHRIPGDPESALEPRLARARLVPGAGLAHAGRRSNLRVDVSDRIVDLQAALGEDRDGDAQATEDRPPSTSDEWLFNSRGDRESDGTATAARALYLRLTTVGRTARADRRYLAPALDRLEDRHYDEADPPADRTEARARSFRRWKLTTTIGLRNLW